MHKPALILIKHAMPEIDPARPAREWPISEDGIASCKPLADALRPYQPVMIAASHEPKATRTGQLVADHLGIPCETRDDLHEHDNTGEPFTSPEDFRASIQRFFAAPDRVVYGRESSHDAGQRMEAALVALVNGHPNQTVAVSSHGRVIASFVRQHNALDVFDFWQRLKLASFAVLSLPDFSLLDVIVPD